MPTPWRDLLAALPAQPKTRLVTGVAGFIGHNLLETPLERDQTVVGLDHFATGRRRCFNLFGPRQDPAGADAAVSPEWIAALLAGADVFINGDCETSRDACSVDNTVQAHLPAATLGNPAAVNPVYTVTVGERTTLNAIFEAIRETRAPRLPHLREVQPRDRDFRPGDVRHSLADINKARRRLGYAPSGSQTDGDVAHFRSDVAYQDLTPFSSRTLAVRIIRADAAILAHARELVKDGLSQYDALHVASAIAGGAAVFVSTDDRLLKRIRNRADIRTLLPGEALAFLESWYEN